jgi:hypothetical protein
MIISTRQAGRSVQAFTKAYAAADLCGVNVCGVGNSGVV